MSEVVAFLMSGNPPILYTLLAINGLFIAVFVIRRMADLPPLSSGMSSFMQALLVAANCLALFQDVVWPYISLMLKKL